MVQTQISHILPMKFEKFELDELSGSVIDRFRKVVAANGNNVALEDAGTELTYHELDRRSNQVANMILDRCRQAPEPVALLYGRAGADLCVSQLGVLKSGRFFVCLDSNVGHAKLVAIARDLQTRLVLCDSSTHALAVRVGAALGACGVAIVAGADTFHDASEPDIKRIPNDIAYVTYTSGSTGAPRGVVISDRCLLHAVMNHTNNMHLNRDDRSAQICALDSGASAGEIFSALLNGGALLPYSIKEEGFVRFARWLLDKKVSIFTAVPTVFRLLIDAAGDGCQFPDIRMLRLAGDRVLASDIDLYKRHFSDKCLMRVTLAATECQAIAQYWVDKTYDMCRQVVPVGYPLEHMEVFIVDDDMQELGPMERGEIAVRSKYLASGYWKNPVLTQERFIEGAREDERVYLTRDCGYVEEDGCLIHIGRKDLRSKVYGKMISLSQVEEVMLAIPAIREAIVVSVGRSGDGRLVAFFVSDHGQKIGRKQITRKLLEELSPENVPKDYLRLQAMPLSKNNKVDRGRLQALADEGAEKWRLLNGLVSGHESDVVVLECS